MSNKKESTRRLLELQGFYGIADHNLNKVDIGLRVAPAFCALLATAATITASANLFWALLPFALLGIVLPGNPFDAVYNYGIRHLIKGPHLPRYAAPRRFACLVASAFVITAALSIQSGAILAGQILGGSLVVAALVPVTTGFCIPSFIYRLFTGKISFNWAVQA